MINLKEMTDKNALKVLDFFSNNFPLVNDHKLLDKLQIVEFDNIYNKAAAGEYDSWLDYKFETLALIISLSQLPRLLYPNSPKAYTTDEDAIEIAKYALNQKADLTLTTQTEKLFLYLPFMQSELLEDQEISIKKFIQHNKVMSEVANFHYETILNFERFPSRNIILNRESTIEETRFLATSNPLYFSYL